MMSVVVEREGVVGNPGSGERETFDDSRFVVLEIGDLEIRTASDMVRKYYVRGSWVTVEVVERDAPAIVPRVAA